MGKDKHGKRQASAKIGGPFVPLLISTIDTPAWRETSHGAQALYIALKRRYDIKNHNNGRIFLSTRMAAEELNSDLHQVGRWFRELQYYGFIVRVTEGAYLGPSRKGKAPHWRLTEVGYMRDPPTDEFKHWNGIPFDDDKGPSKAKFAQAKADSFQIPLMGNSASH
jgi:hypothetical protein